MKSFHSVQSSRKILAVLVASACATLAAKAAEPTGSVRNDGVMTFPNVRVEVAPAAAATATVGHSGMTAFIDPSTGRIGAPTAEGHAALDAASKSNAANAAGRRRAGPMLDERTTLYGARGGIGVKVDEALMSNVVVTRGIDGRLVHQCMPGEDVARLHGKPSATRKSKSSKTVTALQGELK